jgi:hypothetical protein
VVLLEPELRLAEFELRERRSVTTERDAEPDRRVDAEPRVQRADRQFGNQSAPVDLVG